MFYSQSFDMVRLTQVSLNIYIRQFIESVQKNWLYFSGKKSAESNTNDVSWIFTETGHGKGPMDEVGAAIKNAIDDVVIATESMPDVSVRSASDVHKILNLVNVKRDIQVWGFQYWKC